MASLEHSVKIQVDRVMKEEIERLQADLKQAYKSIITSVEYGAISIYDESYKKAEAYLKEVIDKAINKA